MLNKRKTIIIVETIILLLVISVSITFAYLSASGKQELANTFKSGCLNITLSDVTDALNLKNAFPITDIEGLEQEESYKFKIVNTCDTETPYTINLESMNINENKALDPQYVKVALSSNDMDNIIKKLESEDITKPYLEDSKQSNYLYSGILTSKEAKEFTLKEWIDYNTTKEQGAEKEYQSKIYVVSDSREEIKETPKIQFEIDGGNLKGTISGEVQEIKYCITSNNICTPETTINKSDSDTINIKYPYNKGKQIVCTNLDGKTICSNPISPSEVTLSKLGLHSQGKIENITGPACRDNCTIQDQNGVYESEDNNGTSYFFRGTVDNNWVKFGQKDNQDIYWRIIRINGNGSIRLIYSGLGNATAIGEGTMIQNGVKYNNSDNDNAYVGYYFGKTGQSTYEATHTNAQKSSIAEILDKWYSENLESNYDKYIDIESGFCGDRQINNTLNETWYSSDTKRGYNTEETMYSPWGRILDQNANMRDYSKATLKCGVSPLTNEVDNTALKRDLYTTKNAKNGNEVLNKPIGLITADEVVFGGMVFVGQIHAGTNYLYTNRNYWTMSPASYSGYGNANIFVVHSDGFLTYDGPEFENNWPGVRPVINLKAESEFTFHNLDQLYGTSGNPYVFNVVE